MNVEGGMSGGKRHLKLGLAALSLLLGVLFFVSIWTYEVWSRRADENQLKEHARVIAASLWSFDARSPVDYLNIAMRLHHYERMTVFAEPDHYSFIQVEGEPPEPLDQWFLRMRLLWKNRMQVPVYYQGEVIGQLEVEHINKRIYTYLYWFLVVCLIWVGLKLFLQLLHGKQMLEVRVAERTAELENSKERLNVTLDSIGDSVIATDRDGIIVGMNSAASSLSGWLPADAKGKAFAEIFLLSQQDAENEPADLVALVLGTGSRVGPASLSRLRARNGQNYLVAASGAPIRKGESGDVLGVVFVLRDMTEASTLQERLQASEKMQAIGQLAGGIAHDFNNMLGGIMGATDLLRATVPASPTIDKYLDLLSGAAKTASGLADKLLVFSRQRPSSWEAIDLNGLVGDTASLLKSCIDGQIDVRLELTADACSVCGDPALLQSALLNMGINASHSIQGSGAITYCIREVVLDAETCNRQLSRLVPGPFFEVSIIDTGCGIEADVLPHIFEPFFTTRRKGKGTGLGLAVVAATVQQHGGSVAVSSELGKGTLFRVYLPPASLPQGEETSSIQDYRGASELILVVDDEDVIRESASAMLELQGYRVMTAVDGRDGLRRFEEHRDEIDLVLLDMIMPELSGRDCFAQMQQIRPDVRVILCSGFSMQEDVEAMKQAGLCGVLKKPFRKDDLADAVYRGLHA
jgi:PAS domain S-box-containing protein